jgi:hypothetical protein
MKMEELASYLYGDDKLTTRTKELYAQFSPDEENKKSHFRANNLPKLIQALNAFAPEGSNLDESGGYAIVHYLASCAGMVAYRTEKTDHAEVPETKKLEIFTDTMKVLIHFLDHMLDLIKNNSPTADSTDLIKEAYKLKASLMKVESIITTH